MERGIVSSWSFWSQPGFDYKGPAHREANQRREVSSPLAVLVIARTKFIDHPNRANSATFVIASSHSSISVNALSLAEPGDVLPAVN